MGVSTPVGVPLILLQRKHPSRITHWKGNLRSIEVALEFTKGRLSRGSEVQRLASARHSPDQLIPFHHSLTPLVSYPRVGISGF